MSNAGTGPELPTLPSALDDIMRSRRDEGADHSRITPIQQHRMIVSAIEQGATANQIAAALNIPARAFRWSLKLLWGISGQAADLLKDKHVSQRTMWLLRRVNGVRQVEIAELMVCSANYSSAYVEALIWGTTKDQLTQPGLMKPQGISPDTIARMELEMPALERELKAIKASYGANMLKLTLARAYVRKLLSNPEVTKFLSTHYADIHAEFTALAATESI